MEANSVSTTQVTKSLQEFEGEVKSCINDTERMIADCENIISAYSSFMECSGAHVSGYPKDNQLMADGIFEKTCTIDRTFSTSVSIDASSIASNIKNYLETALEEMDKLVNQITDGYSIMDSIYKYTQEVENGLSLSYEEYCNLFDDNLSNHLWESEDRVGDDSKRMIVSDKNKQWWTDNSLLFEYNPNGNGYDAWIVYQMVDGKKVVMGWTDTQTAAKYSNEVMKKVTKNSKNNLGIGKNEIPLVGLGATALETTTVKGKYGGGNGRSFSNISEKNSLGIGKNEIPLVGLGATTLETTTVKGKYRGGNGRSFSNISEKNSLGIGKNETPIVGLGANKSNTISQNITPEKYKFGTNATKTIATKSTSLTAGSFGYNAKQKYSSELSKSKYSYIDNNTYMSVTDGKVGNSSVQITHYSFGNKSNQVKIEQANGSSYKGGVETATHAYNRLKSEGKNPIAVINASNFNQSEGSEWYGTQDFEGANKIAIVRGKLVDTKSGNGTLSNPSSAIAGGAEIAIDKDGNFSRIASGTSAQQLIDQGVQDTISIHETPLVMTGSDGKGYVSPTVDSPSKSAFYDRNVIGQTSNGDIYVVTGATDKRKVAEYMVDELGCNFATSMDQGGSVSNVVNGTEIYNHSDGERAVGDFLVIYGD